MTRQEAIQWWREARFGLFVHWGVYSLLGAGEWVMYQRRIPIKEYEKLAARFNPTDFDADAWVRLAKDAGMRYIVITAKHHDGFSMFRTKVSDFNIVDATPFGRDPMAELAEACRRHGLKLGFYYSHVREWRHPMAQSFETQGRGDRLGNYGNFWDYPDENKKNLQTYIDEFDKPQLRELLSQYGDILTIWFDTPSMIRPDQAVEIRELVYDAQAGCLVNGRLCEGIEVDYLSMGDNEVPACGASQPWETCMTTHNGWGYVKDASFRPHAEMIRQLAEIASKGGNFLLNVGPDATGVIPEGVRKELLAVGEWLRKNGEAIYGTETAPLRYCPKWGRVSRGGDALYLMVTDPEAREIALAGIKSKAISCEALDGGAKLEYAQTGDRLTIELGDWTDDVRVVKLVCPNLEVERRLMPGEDGSISLSCVEGEARLGSDASHMRLQSGVTRLWFDERDRYAWNFVTTEAKARYRAELLLDAGGFWRLEDFGHQLALTCDGQTLRFAVEQPEAGGAEMYGQRVAVAGEITLEAGEHELTLCPETIVKRNMAGLTILGVQLAPLER